MREMTRTVQVQIEVGNGASRFRASVRAATLERALRLVGASYPSSTVHAILPGHPEPVRDSGVEGRPEAVGEGGTGSAA